MTSLLTDAQTAQDAASVATMRAEVDIGDAYDKLAKVRELNRQALELAVYGSTNASQLDADVSSLYRRHTEHLAQLANVRRDADSSNAVAEEADELADQLLAAYDKASSQLGDTAAGADLDERVQTLKAEAERMAKTLSEELATFNEIQGDKASFESQLLAYQGKLGDLEARVETYYDQFYEQNDPTPSYFKYHADCG